MHMHRLVRSLLSACVLKANFPMEQLTFILRALNVFLLYTIFTLRIGTPYLLTILVLKFEIHHNLFITLLLGSIA